jgi:hypothetical protein
VRQLPVDRCLRFRKGDAIRVKVFVSSSWRNERQPEVVRVLKDCGHEVYDFRNPGTLHRGFSWSEIDEGWRDWTALQFRDALSLPRVVDGFYLDMDALRSCDACVMVQPCGRSAALELGWAAGAGKPTIVLLDDGEPELMLKMADYFCLSLDEVVDVLGRLDGVT